MQNIHQSIFIAAPREHVWDVMLGDATYREWTAAFHEGSYYDGRWEEGAKILFLGPGEKGPGGMVARVAESRRPEFVSLEMLGLVEDGVENVSGEEAKKWASARESYTFAERDGGTELSVDLSGLDDESAAMFAEMWPKALLKLKELAERGI